MRKITFRENVHGVGVRKAFVAWHLAFRLETSPFGIAAVKHGGRGHGNEDDFMRRFSFDDIGQSQLGAIIGKDKVRTGNPFGGDESGVIARCVIATATGVDDLP